MAEKHLSIGNFSLMRSDSIDPESILHFAQEIKKTDVLRISILQLNLPLQEWSKIQQQHYILVQAAKQAAWAHLSFPTESTRLLTEPEKISEFDVKVADKLMHLLNVEAWATYCDWIGTEVKACLMRFLPDALDEYQLQARFDDFLHELNSTILIDIRKNLADILLEQSQVEESGDKSKLLTLEKMVVSSREKLKTLIVVQWHILNDIVEGITKIEKAHPELHHLKLSAYLLSKLMGPQLPVPNIPKLSWPQRLLLHQLLDQQLQVLSVVNGGEVGCADMVFRVRAELCQLSRQHSIDSLVNMSERWDTLPPTNPFKKAFLKMSFGGG